MSTETKDSALPVGWLVAGTPTRDNDATRLRAPTYRRRSRHRRVGVWIGWIVAVLCFIGGLASAWSMAWLPSSLAHDPVTTQARVTDSFINGFGGDPAVDYEYWVDGRRYTGSGTQDDQHRDLLLLDPGATVRIRYARAAPSQSCMCNPTDEEGSLLGYVVDAAFLLPLPVMSFRARQRRRERAGALRADPIA